MRGSCSSSSQPKRPVGLLLLWQSSGQVRQVRVNRPLTMRMESKMKIEVDTVTLPAYYASAFVNGDYSGLDDREESLVNKLVADLAKDGFEIVDVARDEDGEGFEPRFTWSYRLYGGDANGGEVLDYVVHRIKE